MLKWIIAITVVSAGLALQACAPKKTGQDSEGYVQNVYGERISWKGQTPITIYVHESVPSQYVGAIEAAAKTWEAAAGHRLFYIQSQKMTGPILPQKDGSSVIYFMSNWEADRSSEQARTSVYWVGDQIQEADMRINANFQFYWNQSASNARAINFEALVLHEMGHILGLKHRDDEPSVMATYLPSNANRTTLYPDDIAAIKIEY